MKEENKHKGCFSSLDLFTERVEKAKKIPPSPKVPYSIINGWLTLKIYASTALLVYNYMSAIIAWLFCSLHSHPTYRCLHLDPPEFSLKRVM